MLKLKKIYLFEILSKSKGQLVLNDVYFLYDETFSGRKLRQKVTCRSSIYQKLFQCVP